MHLTLFLPGLFGPGTRFSEEFIPRADALEMLLSRGDLRRSPRQSFHRTLSLLFGYAADNGRDVAVAAVTRLLDGGEAPAGCWMRADPVCLVPDRHGLVLMDAASLGLNMQDALALAAEIRPALRIADCELEVPAPERWYLHIDDAPALCTRELDSVVGQDIQSALPTGSDASRWHRLLNEIQMLMHGSGVNQDR
ncbi:MAG: hypothetical protein HYY36_06285 [Gammaproteobacteria bacterium]|nr:hypothetical protein [Gammaproteobacteria bacterium]